MAQTPDGYLWLGSEFGLFHFDGVSFVRWQPPDGEQLPARNIYSLLAARDGTLWIGTFAGLASWHDGRLTRFHEFDRVFVTSLLEDRHGTVWVGGMSRPRRSSLCSARTAAARVPEEMACPACSADSSGASMRTTPARSGWARILDSGDGHPARQSVIRLRECRSAT